MEPGYKLECEKCGTTVEFSELIFSVVHCLCPKCVSEKHEGKMYDDIEKDIVERTRK